MPAVACNTHKLSNEILIASMFRQMLKLFSCIGVVVVAGANKTLATGTTDGSLNGSRIIYGADASLNETKYQVSIRTRAEESVHFGFGHTCGGSLISDNVVLTAAHCFLQGFSSGGSASYHPDKDLVVVMGNLDRFEYNRNTLVFDIVKTVKGSFNVRTNEEDIALVFLNGTVPAGHPTAKPIILNEGPVPNRTVCQATGWGLTDVNEYSQMLRTVDLPIIDLNECRNESVYGSRIREGMLCAGYLDGGPSPCCGDSGGALVCHGVQVGVLSWGYGSGCPLRPIVSTDVALYKEWILKAIRQHNGSQPEFASMPAGTSITHSSICLIVGAIILNFLHIGMSGNT